MREVSAGILNYYEYAALADRPSVCPSVRIEERVRSNSLFSTGGQECRLFALCMTLKISVFALPSDTLGQPRVRVRVRVCAHG